MASLSRFVLKDHPSRLLNSSLIILFLILNVSLFGYVFFSLNPQNFVKFPSSTWIYGHALTYTAQFQIWLSFWVMIYVLARETGLSWLRFFFIAAGLGLASEFIGITTGLPFGSYHYSNLLGPKIFQHVPIVIPLSWFFMSIAIYIGFGIKAKSERSVGKVLRIAICALALMTWDLLLDPAMSYLTNYWIWNDKVFFYNSPFINFVGWFLVGFIIFSVFEALGGQKILSRIPRRFIHIFLFFNIYLPFGMLAFAGAWWALATFTIFSILLLSLKKILHSLI